MDKIKSWPPTQEELNRPPKAAREGKEILMRTRETPEFKLASKILAVWSDTLSDEEKQWFQCTPEGNREMWERYLCCLPPHRTHQVPPQQN